MENRYSEDHNRKPHNGAGQLYLTLLRKNRDEVEIALTNGRILSGYIDAFDEQGIVVGSSTDPDKNNETYVTRQQVVTIKTKISTCYLSVD